jgi:hypothetical protein
MRRRLAIGAMTGVLALSGFVMSDAKAVAPPLIVNAQNRGHVAPVIPNPAGVLNNAQSRGITPGAIPGPPPVVNNGNRGFTAPAIPDVAPVLNHAQTRRGQVLCVGFNEWLAAMLASFAGDPGPLNALAASGLPPCPDLIAVLSTT